MGTAIKHPVPDRVKLSLVVFDIRTIWRSGLSTGCYIAVPIATVGVKGLTKPIQTNSMIYRSFLLSIIQF